MDELLAAMQKVQISFEEFDNLLFSAIRLLQEEVERMRNDCVPEKNIQDVFIDVAALEKFHSVSATQRQYADYACRHARIRERNHAVVLATDNGEF
ncbi:MAG: hypothetical protein ACI4TU_08425 [Candidatus Cryptobacteroides sp.]